LDFGLGLYDSVEGRPKKLGQVEHPRMLTLFAGKALKARARQSNQPGLGLGEEEGALKRQERSVTGNWSRRRVGDLEEQQNPKRGAIWGEVNYQTPDLRLRVEQGLEVEAPMCGHPFAGERSGGNGKGARAAR
jgi:hypothetical protein